MVHLTKNDVETIAYLILENWGQYNKILCFNPNDRFYISSWGGEDYIEGNIGFPNWDGRDDYYNKPSKKMIRSYYWGVKDWMEQEMNQIVELYY